MGEARLLERGAFIGVNTTDPAQLPACTSTKEGTRSRPQWGSLLARRS